MESQVPFEDYARPRPLRTYSHKVWTASPSVLPLLRTRHSPTSLARKHQREPEPQNKTRHNNGVIPEEDTVADQAEYDYEDANELEFEPQYASDTSHSPGDYATEGDTSLEYSTDEDTDERRTTEESKSTTPPSSSRSSSSTKYIPKSVTDQSNRLRRRPFLLFDKLPPRGFKRLKPKVEGSTTASLSAKYKLGDGFSKDEAKPNGLVQLGLRPTAKRKAPQVVSRVGALDLTQSSFTRSPKRDRIVNQKKKTMTKKRAYDNSFLPDTSRAERQRKRHKLLKKKDNPLEDKEMLPPTVMKPKIILKSAILGDYANQVEGRQQTSAVTVSEQQQRKQPRNEMESALEGKAHVPLDQHEEDNVDPEAVITREPSIELGESPARRNVSVHSPSNHQEIHHPQQEAVEEKGGDAVEVLSEEGGQRYGQKHFEQPREQFSEKPLQKPAQKPVEEQERPANNGHAGEDDSKPVIFRKRTNAKPMSTTELSSSKCGTVDQSQIHTTTDPAKLASHASLGKQHHRQKSHQDQVKGQDQDAPPSEVTSPGSGWETYISETDIHTPTPLRPLNSRAKSAVPSISRGPANLGLRRSNSAV